MLRLRWSRVRLARALSCYYNSGMTRDEALAKLRPMEADLRARGIEALYLFGSVARGDARPDSDVDLMCEIRPNELRGLKFFEVQADLEDALQTRIDFLESRMLKDIVRARVEPDLVRVF
jgi:uncharacterized protein